MDRKVPDAVGGTPTEADAQQNRLLTQLRSMFAALVRSQVRARLAWLALGLAVVIGATAYGQIRLNEWNRPFYDALSHHEFDEFLRQLGIFAVIAGALLILNVAQQWLQQMLTLKLREGLVHDLVDHWLQPRRAFRIAHAGPLGVNPDQRMHEDARHLTELSAALGIGLLQSSVLLGAFVAVLWALSSHFVLPLGHHAISIPGYMVWAAVIYAASASLLSWAVGHGLIQRNAARYAREADLRYTLVRVNEHIDAISLAGGEAEARRQIDRDLVGVLSAMRSLVTGLTRLTWVTAGYGWFTLVAPILAAAPLYFHGELSFGGLMMAAGAFTQVQSSLRWFVDNFSTIADWRATLLRVAAFREAVVASDQLHAVANQILIEEGEPGRLLLDHLEIASPTGCTLLQEGSAQIRSGERVLIVGPPGVGKTLLFRTLAGLWPWGAGRIVLPRGQQLFFMPRVPYLPPGTLRDVLAYPRPAASYHTAAFTAALNRSGLQELVSQLDVQDRWERRLNAEAQVQLTLARAILHAPEWLIIDNLFDTLAPAVLDRILEVLGSDLRGSAVIHIGSSFTHHPQFPRVLHLRADPAQRRLERRTAVAA